MSPCPGKCLAHAAMPPASSPATKAATWRATSSASEPKERTPMIGLSAVVFTSATGAKSRLMPARGEVGGHRAGHRPRQLDVVDDAERPVSGIRAACLAPRGASRRRPPRRWRPRARAARPAVRRSANAAVPGRARSRRRGRRRRAPPRAGGESSPAAPRRGSRAAGSPGRGARARRPSRRHPLTAPDVSPNLIRRCKSRKNATTGIAVSVDAAIRPPQSVLRLPPVKYESHTVSVWFD